MTISDEQEGSRGNRVENALTSFILIALTLCISIICVVVLAATLTQARISGLAIEGVSLSIWKLDTVRQGWAVNREQQQRQNRALGVAEVKKAGTSARRTAAESQYNNARNALSSLLEELNFRIRPFDATLASAISGQSPAEQVGRIEANLTALQEHKELKELLERLNPTYKTYQKTRAQRDTDRASDDALAGEISNLKTSLEGTKDALDSLFGTIKLNLDEATRSRIENALYELQPSAGLFSKFSNRLVTAHPDVLTLFLVILMGILGSALQIAHAFFKENQRENPGSYLLRICVGAITALVIFIVAKAGVPVIADASKLGGDAPINPYFVSFLAILSGLLSENAIGSVQAQGAKFFGASVSAAPDRWSRGDLNNHLQSPEFSLKQLSEYLELSEDTTKAILAGETKAAPAQQNTIALYLRKDVRDLFSDIAPATAV